MTKAELRVLWTIRAKIAELENIFANDRDPMRADNFYRTQKRSLNMLDQLLDGESK